MLNNFLNLEGITLLNKNEQGNVNGGYVQECKFTVIDYDGTHVRYIDGFSSGAKGSSEARDLCDETASMDMHTRCFYDCEYDGYGQ